jgi:hypothetical protein
MKKTIFGLFAIGFVLLSSFTTKETILVDHNCNYRFLYANGQSAGSVTLSIPDGVPCDSKKAKAYALAFWNLHH